MNNKPRKPRSVRGKVLSAARIIAIPVLLLAFFYNLRWYKVEATHSIETSIKIETGEYTQEIIDAFIAGDALYLTVFYYPTDVGITQNPRRPFTAYETYYNGKKLGHYNNGYGGDIIQVSFKMPRVNRNRLVGVSLYEKGEFLTNLALYPKNAPPFTARPSAAVGNAVLAADVRKSNEGLRIMIDFTLLKNLAPDRFGGFLGGWQGFMERGIYLKDTSGNIYRYRGAEWYNPKTDSYTFPGDESLYDTFENLILYIQSHVFFFDVPEDMGNFEIVIPELIYSEMIGPIYYWGTRTVENSGPWVLPVSADDIQTGY